MPEFLLLTYGLCAGLTSWGPQPTVSFGYVSRGQCIVHLVVGSEGTVPWAGHDITVRFIEGGAVISIDDGPETVLQVGEPA